MTNKIWVYGPKGARFVVKMKLMPNHETTLSLPDPAGTTSLVEKDKVTVLEWQGTVLDHWSLLPSMPTKTSADAELVTWLPPAKISGNRVSCLSFETAGMPVMSVFMSMYPGGKAIRVRSEDVWIYMTGMLRSFGMTDIERHEIMSTWLMLLTSQPQVLIHFPHEEFYEATGLAATFPEYPDQTLISAVRVFFIASPLPPDVQEYGYNKKHQPTEYGPWPLWKRPAEITDFAEPPDRDPDWFGVVQVVGSFCPPPRILQE